MVLELGDLDSDRVEPAQGVHGGVQVGEVESVGNAVVGGDDAGLEDVAVEVDVDLARTDGRGQPFSEVRPRGTTSS